MCFANPGFEVSQTLSVLADVSGVYMHEENYFMIYNMEPRARRLNFVHEGTHIIQDWQDVSSFAHHNEADAFIAQAVAELTLYADAPETDDVSKKALAAAKMVSTRPQSTVRRTGRRRIKMSSQRLATATRNMACASTWSKKARVRANGRNIRNCCEKSPCQQNSRCRSGQSRADAQQRVAVNEGSPAA